MRTETQLLRFGAVAAGVLLAICPTTRAEPENRVRYGATVGFGADSNPLRVSDDGPGGSFTQLLVNGSFTRLSGPRTAFFVSGNARTRLHSGSTSNADSLGAETRAGVGFSPDRWGGRLAIGAGGEFSVSRSTFIDRQTGQVYTVDPAGGGAGPEVPIGDRFDQDTYGVFFNARWVHNRRLKLFFDGNWERSRYAEDYAANTDLSALDYRAVTLEPGARWTVNRTLEVGVSLALTDLDYDARPALGEDGSEMPDAMRRYRYTRLRTTFSITPGPRWNLRVGLDANDRQDGQAGYLDYASRAVFVSADREIGPRSEFSFYVSRRDLEYDRATVADEPDALRATDVVTLVARHERRVSERLAWFADLGSQDTDSVDPVFAHGKSWVFSGVRFRSGR